MRTIVAFVLVLSLCAGCGRTPTPQVAGAEEAWATLLHTMEEKFALEKNLLDSVVRGDLEELADHIQVLKAQKGWAKMFEDRYSWDDLLKRTYALDSQFNELDPRIMKPKLAKLEPGKLQPLAELLQKELQDQAGECFSDAEMQHWIKDQAWRQLLINAMENPDWSSFLRQYWHDLFRIQPGHNEQLITFILCRGNVLNQATMTALTPALGLDVFDNKPPNDYKTIKEFVEARFGPSLADIRQVVRDESEKSGREHYMTDEEVLQKKTKRSQLEFRILANSTDDKEAMDAAANYFLDPMNKAIIEERQRAGLPPPGPFMPDRKTPKVYQIRLHEGELSMVSYGWVELGPSELRQLYPDNVAEVERDRSKFWPAAPHHRDWATELRVGNAPLLQGALFFSRECRNRNLSEKERRAKKVEYFVLARNPEIDQADPLKRETPRIGGEYVVRVQARTIDSKPVVFLNFNEEGARLMFFLSAKNLPGDTGPGSLRRHLAILVDGAVISAPTIMSKMGADCQIHGNFTQKEVDDLVNALRPIDPKDAPDPK